MKYSIPFLLMIALLLNACIQSQFSFDEQGTKEYIRATIDSSAYAWNQGDLEGYMSFYYKHDSLMFVGNKSKTYGWENTLLNYKKSYPDKKRMGYLEFSDIEIRFLTRYQVLVSGQWKLKRENDEPFGRFTLYMVYLAGGWKIVYDHSSG